MGAIPSDQAERPLLRWQGNPYGAVLQRLSWWRLLAPYLPALTALVVAMSAFSAASVGFVDSGVTVERGTVSSVATTGFAWNLGVRVDREVLGVVEDDAGETTVLVAGTHAPIMVNEARQNGILRKTVGLALIALVLAAVAVAGRAAAPGFSTVAAMIALPLATVPLSVQGDPLASTVALAAAAIVPVGWAVGRLRWRRIRIAAASTGIVALTAWTVARLAGLDAYPAIEGIRSTVALALVVVAAVAVLLLPAWRGRGAGGRIRVRPLDVLVFGVLFGGSVVLLNVLYVPDLIVAGILVAGLALYPATRHRLAAGADRLVLGGVRETAAIAATERERSRMASELHDSSMQELSGIIRRLERLPGAAPERDALREVAQRLREVATGMRPPMLDDLGLGPALGYLADRAARPGLVVTVNVDDATGISPAERVAPDVELEIYRICEEAVNNAVTHAGATRVEITGRVSIDEVRLRIDDDGVGMTDAATERAQQAGRLGLVSMRRRGATIGATVSVTSDGAGHGVSVEVGWRR